MARRGAAALTRRSHGCRDWNAAHDVVDGDDGQQQQQQLAEAVASVRWKYRAAGVVAGFGQRRRCVCCVRGAVFPPLQTSRLRAPPRCQETLNARLHVTGAVPRCRKID